MLCAVEIGVGIGVGIASYDQLPLGTGWFWSIGPAAQLPWDTDLSFSASRYSAETVTWPPLPSTIIVVTKEAALMLFDGSLERIVLERGIFRISLGAGAGFYILGRRLEYSYEFDPMFTRVSEGLDTWHGWHLMTAVKVRKEESPVGVFLKTKYSVSYPPDGCSKGPSVNGGLAFYF